MIEKRRSFQIVALFLFYFSASKNIFTCVDYENFSEIAKSIIENYQPVVFNFHQQPLNFVLSYDTHNTIVVDSVRKVSDEFMMTITGKVPKESVVNQEALAILICHELGHILGTGPKQKIPINYWSSVEGEADYYATNVCMKEFVEILPPKTNLENFDRNFIDMCQDHFEGKEILNCMRIMSGIVSMQNFFNLSAKEKLSIYTPDKTIVNNTLSKYPSDQCRIDTFIAGLFNKERPKCWYAG